MAFQHGQRLRLDGLTAEPLTLRLSVNRRARRVSIRIDARVGEAVVTAPSERRLKDGVDFARAKAAWIAERLAVRPPSSPLAPGGAIPLQGRTVRLAATGGTGVAAFAARAEPGIGTLGSGVARGGLGEGVGGAPPSRGMGGAAGARTCRQGGSDGCGWGRRRNTARARFAYPCSSLQRH